MPPINQTRQSFVPKKPISGEPRRTKASAGLFFSASVLLFVVMVGLAGSVYLYGTYVEKNTENMKTSLERAKDAFEPSLIVELKKLDMRMKSAQQILHNHVAFSEFFKLLEENTLQTVAFDAFTYRLDEEANVEINLSGVAESYSSVALQSDLFGENESIKNSVFSDLSLEENGNISFTVSANLDSEYILYEKHIK